MWIVKRGVGTKQKKTLPPGEKRHLSVGEHTRVHYTQYWISEIHLKVAVILFSQPIYPAIFCVAIWDMLGFQATESFGCFRQNAGYWRGYWLKLDVWASWTHVVSAAIHNWITYCDGGVLCVCRCRGGGISVREWGKGSISIWPEHRGFPIAWKRNETPVIWFFSNYLQE